MSDEKKEATTTPPKRKLVRSPNSPSLSLGDALAKAKIIYDIEKKIPTTPEVMLSHIGYEKPDSGPAGRAFSALRQYGLVSEVESGKYRISEASFRYFELPPEAPERQKILREAALKPALFKELIDRHKDGVLPSDATLRSHLVLEKGFNPNTVEDFIRVFRQTIAVAKPFDGGYTQPSDEDKGKEAIQPVITPTPPRLPVNPKERVFGAPPAPDSDRQAVAEWSLNLSRDSDARVVIYGKPSQEAIDKLSKFLELQKDTFPTRDELEAPAAREASAGVPEGEPELGEGASM